MGENKTNAEAVKDYQKQLDDIKVRVPKGYREIIKNYAKSQGISLNQLVIRAIQADAAANGISLEVPAGIKEYKKLENNWYS
mgnify:CR=1 FL=1